MRSYSCCPARGCVVEAGVFGILVLLTAGLGRAQTPAAPGQELVSPPSWAANDISCAPALTKVASDTTLRVIGSQDPTVKQLFGPGDTLVISGGTEAGLQPGQRYFVRRALPLPGAAKRDPLQPLSVHTAGWVQILGVDSGLATATIVYACDGFLPDDYLEAFTPPAIAARPLPGNTPEYENMGRIIGGDENRATAGVGEMMTIDRGSNTGVVHGQRFLVFRDKQSMMVQTHGRSKTFALMAGKQPLVEIGQVLVIAVAPDSSTVQVLVSRDAVTSGDLVAPIR